MIVELDRTLPTGADAVVHAATVAAPVPAGIDAHALESLGFEGKRDQVVVLPGAEGEPVIAVVGLGDVDPESLVDDTSPMRRAVAVAVRALRRHDVIALCVLDVVIPARRASLAAAVAEGAVLGAYRFTRYKSGDSNAADGVADSAGLDSAASNSNGGVERVVVVAGGGQRAVDAVARGVAVGEAQCLARDLVNEPGGALTPQAFAEVAVEVAERENLQITVMDLADITEAGLGGLLGVNRGSTNEPRMLVLSYLPKSPRGRLALVGKGITFDSGGLSIKGADSMMTMKMDMGGAAAVLGAFSALSAVGTKAEVHGFIPLTDNMLGGDATRPGDVLRIRNGTTVEVLNTDSEGRLVLADALSLACEGEPDAIIDLATLTGAVDVALGPGFAGLLGNNDSWVAQVTDGATRAGERVWQLPLPDDYRPWLDSDVADLRNISRVRSAGSIVAGLFLSNFVDDDTPWVHLDIAASAWSSNTNGCDVFGGTGWGVRTLLEVARTFRRPR